MKAGDRVLIHAATGGVGLAALQIAQRAGAEIFATAGSPEKRQYLQSLGVEHIMNSRTLDFAGRDSHPDQRRRHRHRSELAGRRVHPEESEHAAGGRTIPGDRQGGHLDRRTDGGSPSGHRLLPNPVGRSQPGSDPGDAARSDGAVFDRRAPPAAASSVPDRRSRSRLPLHGAGEAHRQDRHHAESVSVRRRPPPSRATPRISSPAASVRSASTSRKDSSIRAHSTWC